MGVQHPVVLLLAVALAMAVSGRLLVAGLPLPRLRRCDPTATAATIVAASMVWLLVATTLSRLGLSEGRILVAILAAHGVLVVVLGPRAARSFRPVGAAGEWAALSAVLVLAAATALLPVLLTGGFGLGYDNFFYCSGGEWLRDHPFSERAEFSPFAPIAAVVGMWQRDEVALGASHALALLLAAGASSALVAYPVAGGWAFLLGALTVVLAARWAVRLSPAWAWAAGFAFALLPHPVLWAQHNGFFAQTHGVAGLLLGLAAMGLPPRRRDPSGPVLVGLAAAYAMSVYVPFLPLLGAGGAAWLVRPISQWRGGLARRSWPAVAAVAVFLVGAGLDLRPLFRVLPVLVRATTGGPSPWSAPEWFAFAMGTRAWLGGHAFVDLAPFLSLAAGVAAAVLAVAGSLAVRRRHSARGLVATFLTLAGLVVWYAAFVTDPWTGRGGHTWSVFKAVQWAYPLLLVLQAAGGAHLCRRLGRAGALALAVLALALSAVQATWAREVGLTMREAVPTASPLRDAVRIREGFRAMPAGRLVLLGRPASLSPWLAIYTALLAYPRPLTLDWEDSAGLAFGLAPANEAFRADLERLEDPGLLFVATRVEGLTDARVLPLGGPFVRLLDPARPQLAQVIDPGAVARFGEGGRLLGADRTKLVVTSPKPGPARVVLRTLGAHALPFRVAIQVIPDLVGGPAFRAAVRAAPTRLVTTPAGEPIELDVALVRGQTTLALSLSSATSTTVEIGGVSVGVGGNARR